MALARARSVWGRKRIAPVGGHARPRPARGEVDDLHPGVPEPAVEQPGEQHRVHLGHVVAPEHEHVGVVDVLVAAHRLVQAEGRHEAGDGARHAEAGVGLDVVGPDAGLHELGGDVAVRDGPLPGAVDRHGVLAVALDRLGHLRGHQVEGLLHRHRDERAVLPDQRPGEAVLAVEGHHGVIALDAAEALVHGARRVALDGDGAPPGHADQEAAADAAEPARRLLPREAVGRRWACFGGREDDAREEGLSGARRRGGHGALEQLTTSHGATPRRSPAARSSTPATRVRAWRSGSPLSASCSARSALSWGVSVTRTSTS